jgi:tetratricopeptide (TPR) repeat protein
MASNRATFFMPASRFPHRSARSLAWLAGWAVAGSLLIPNAGCRFAGLGSRESQAAVASRDFGNQGLRAMEAQDWQAAENLLAKAVKACPTDAEARERYAEAMWQSGRREDALTELANAIRLAPTNAKPQVRLAEMQLELGRTDLAGRAANRAIDLDSQSPAAWRVRGRAYAQAGEHRRALQDFQRALAFAKDDRAVLMDVAETYRRLEQPRRMLAVLERLKHAYPPGETPQEVLYLQGIAYRAEDRLERAAECFAEALARGPANEEISLALADARRIAPADETRQAKSSRLGMNAK